MSGRPEVEQDDVRPARLPAPQRRRAVAGLVDPVAARGAARGPARAGVSSSSSTTRTVGPAGVAPAVGSRRGLDRRPVRGHGGQRQVEVDGQAAELAPPGRDAAAHRLDQAAHHGQADAVPERELAARPGTR